MQKTNISEVTVSSADFGEYKSEIMRKIMKILDNFGNREWVFSGLLVHILLILASQMIISLMPQKEISPPRIKIVSNLNFVEYEEIKIKRPVETQDLSDKIIETDKKDINKINWQNAVDPTMDFSKRYRPLFQINYSNEDYPSGARRSNLPRVIVNFTMLINEKGKIQDIKIRRIRSQGNAHILFEAEFRKAVRKILLRQTRLLSKPYIVNGSAVAFTWDSRFEFILK